MRIPQSILALAVGTGVLLIAGVVVALATARQQPAGYPAGSPQGTVATYLRLLQSGQVDRAYGLVSTGIEPALTREEFHQQYDNWSQTSRRVTLLQATASGDTASLTVEIAAFSAGAFGASDQTSRQTFTLVREGGGWRITGPAYVYP